MRPTLLLRYPARLRMLSAAILLATAACGSTAPEGKEGSPGEAVPVSEVRALVRQFGEGGDDKDVAGEAFYNLGDRASPALQEIVRDPATSLDELDSIIFITNAYVKSPELLAALRTRAAAIPDAEERGMRLELIDALENANAPNGS